MADVTRSPFDLRSWQGLTAVLKAARESSLSPLAYAQFRNIVLEYAQKGGDAELKKKIDAIIGTFGTPDEKKASDSLEPKPASQVSSNLDSHRNGRRITPIFTATKAHVEAEATSYAEPTPKVDALPPTVSIGREDVVKKNIETVPEVQLPPLPIPQVAHIPESLMTLEENRARIMEIKHRVNALVGNPVTLMEKGNGIGRSYMGALLTAMKATSPGSTTNVFDAMQKLEESFREILTFTATKNNGAAMAPEPVPPKPILPPIPVPPTVAEEITDTVIEVPIPIPVAVPPVVIQAVQDVPIKKSPLKERVTEIPVDDVENDSRWSKDDEEISRRAAREVTKVIEESSISRPSAERGRRSFLPSLVDIEEDTLSLPNSTAEATWHAHTIPDDLSTASVLGRPESSMTGVTLGTPQAELMSKQVTAALEQLLHGWHIFSSSGLFGMGPGGMEHPVYQQIALLTMGEVLSSRWENANPKVAHSVKDYADAWRHEQSISYLPTETFEHYLRRVAQRIMKRQNGEIIVS